MEKKNELNSKELNHCVVHDDTHEWGGMEPTYDIPNIPKVPLRDMVKDADTLLNELLKKFPEIHIDEPMNWPYR